jgi:prepilin-type N-terminal cleavage/methylation domain-containing protein/prepilin-type processing-associated H-X9-DG protein
MIHQHVWQRRGFTLVELLVVIAIIGILLAIMIPAVQAVRESSRRTACQNNLRQVGIGLTTYESAHRRWPPGRKWAGPPSQPRTFLIAWSALVLDQIEESSLHNSIDFTRPLTDPVNMPATGQVIPIYLCPSTSRIQEHRTESGRLGYLDGLPGEGLGCIDYLGISGPHKDAKHPITKEPYGRQRGVLIGTKGLPDAAKLLEPPPITSARITDGLSRTMCVTECTGRGVDVKDGLIDALHGAWASGNNITHLDDGINSEDPPKAWYKERIISDHPGGAHVLMCDTSVHFMSNDTPKRLLRWLASRDGGESINDEDLP